MNQPTEDVLFSSGHAARILGFSQSRLWQLTLAGVIPALTLQNGHRVYRRADIDRLRAERAERLALQAKRFEAEAGRLAEPA